MFRFSAAYFKAHPEKRGPQPRPSDNHAVTAKLAEARRLAEAYEASEAKLDGDMHTIMRCVLELHEQASKDENAGLLLADLLKQEGVRVTRNTTNEFIPLMKLVPPNLPKSTVGRAAAVLDYASRNNIASASLRIFVEEEGGIANCAKSSKASLKPARDQKSAERSDARLQTLREHAKPFPKSALAEALPEGLSRCLIEKRNGRVVFLSVRSEKSASGYPPLV